jgi:hypothetical protein
MSKLYYENELTCRAKEIIKHYRDPKEQRLAQAIYMPNALGLSLEETSKALQCSQKTVINYRKEFADTIKTDSFRYHHIVPS